MGVVIPFCPPHCDHGRPILEDCRYCNKLDTWRRASLAIAASCLFCGAVGIALLWMAS